MLFALRDVNLNQDGDRWKNIGLDLDGLDSQLPVPEVECIPPNTEAEPETDGTEGIDNAFGHRLFPIVALALPELESGARLNQAAGLGTILLNVSGWNGERNDPRIDAVLSQSAAGTSASADSVSFSGYQLMQGIGLAPAPAWDGNDNYFARDDTFFRGDITQPIVRDDNAYISDGTAVMRLPDRIDILFFAGADAGVRVRLTDGFAIARLSDDLQAFEVATVSGRWSIIDLLDTGENIGICIGTPERRIVETQLDTIADVRSRPDTGGDGVICDAISLGASFTGLRANLVGLGPSRDLPNPCGSTSDGGVDSGIDAGVDGG